MHDEQQKTKERIKAGFSYDKPLYYRRRVLIAVLKPLIGCVVCYSSFWTIVLHTALYGFDYVYIPVIIIHIFMVCALNALFLNLYE